MNNHNTNTSTATTKAGSASSKTMSGKESIPEQALRNAVTNQSTANFETIIKEFSERGIDPEKIIPRVNVFTFQAWRALNRTVRKGEHGVKIVTVIPCTKKDKETGDEIPVNKVKNVTVFHISQTDALTAAATENHDNNVDTTLQRDETEATSSPNHYELRVIARKERLQQRAAGMKAQSGAVYRKARSMADVIPLGQPIMVGHHSERRDRKYRAKITDTFGKAFKLADHADALQRKADSVGTGGISSDDPDAIKKLRAELKDMVKAHEQMKLANAAIKNNTDEGRLSALVSIGFSNETAINILTPDFMGRIGFPSYSLTNNSANMRRVKQRIATLEQQKTQSTVEHKTEMYTYREDVEENRVMFIFAGKPDAGTREVLNRNAFRFSPSRNAWVRKLNNAGKWAATQVKRDLNHEIT